MTKRITIALVLLSAIVYGFMQLIPGPEAKDTKPAQPSSLATATDKPAAICKVITGIENGHVNLRSCAGLACSVLLVLEEGQALTVIRPGAWQEVKTELGAQGWINSNYCKSK